MTLKKCLFSIILLVLFKLGYAKDPLNEGFLLLEKGEYNKAFSALSSIKTKTPQVLTAKGISKYFLKDYRGSIFYLEEALKFESEKKNWVPNFFAGLSSYELKNLSEATYYFRNAYNLKPSKDTSLWLGRTLFEQGEYSEGEKILLEALKEDKKNEEIYEILLNLYYKLGNIEKVKETISLGRRENLNNPIFKLYEAKVYMKKGDMEKVKEIIDTMPKDKYAEEIESLISSLPVFEKKGKSKDFTKLINNKVDYKKSIIYLVVIGILSLWIIGLFYSSRKKDWDQKLNFALELLKKKDYNGCEEIINSIGQTNYEKFKILKIKLLTLKGNFLEALDLCEELKSMKTKVTLKAYIYLISNDLTSFKKLIDYIELTDMKNIALELKKLEYHDTNTLNEFLINFE